MYWVECLFPRVRRMGDDAEAYGPTGLAVEWLNDSHPKTVRCYWGTIDGTQHLTDEEVVLILDRNV